MAGVKTEHVDGEPLNPPKRQRIQDTTPPIPIPTASSSAMTQANGASYTPLRGKVYAITGGASGIGLATAQLLSHKGATVCIADIDPEAIKDAEEFFSGLGAPHMTTKVDVSKRTQVDSWVTSIVDKYGRLDGAANVAGVIGKGHGIASVAELDDDEWDKIIGVNLTGTMYCLRAELRNVVDGGSIVNVSSIHGLKGWFFPPPSPPATSFPPKYVNLANGPLGFAKHAAYDASKHGIVGLTKAAALENGDREIRVNAVAPGAIYTPLMQKNWDSVGRARDAPFDDPSAFRRQGTAEETANVIVFLLGPESTFVSGSVYQVDGAWI
ncbi:short chain dehydrogenase family protein [Metarhizium guizhouense ARSEF 977]|uniref:Short chain dehydrogenase family protein n=1 Tax=Metarhizium guizhouense (strain ARSEF 977) TaxID=1276136 RepID=A0A0B4GXJ7_METGA|nr:short chain dehydrogenase family protein [Metarhizium guizhouense ARSEF 977]